MGTPTIKRSHVLFFLPELFACEGAIYQNDRWRKGGVGKASDIFFPKGPITLLGLKRTATHCSYYVMFWSVHPLATSIFDDI
jgi:hypothetical protein